ncbi:DUF5018 domain-containing protein [Sunxiuqinia dokdonensis]|uniref:DUF5018 domain-containing protein n=1 Tax=Sunxiuqinia dokdonensis TaxID=1409788 RepID=A0A0L8V8D0_9BACT|nr:DUF5018 domain-containing protein [Sunxiuqinia dokdonensis]KOH44618.1 hypothetical protein NC99_26030 [Sunxiuqinia dokdonensis]
MEIKHRIMRNNKFIAIMLVLLTFLGGCHEPDELLPSVSRDGINSITATFEDGTGQFTGYLSEDIDEIVIPIPYFFPESSDNQVTEEMLKRMRVTANLDDNVVVSPALLYLDLTQENMITITDQVKAQRQIIVKGEIRKSSESLIKDFSLPSLGLSGVINEAAKTISLVAIGDLEPALGNVALSYHATISPDPRTTELDYNSDVELTVTAHDGVTQNVYTVKKEVPEKLAYGIRSGSAKLMFAKKLKADLGITVDHLTGGMAAAGDYVVLNTRNASSVYIDAKTGEKLGEIDLGAITGSLTNFYSTADADGNVLICNLAPNAGAFKIWKLTSLTSTPELMIEWDGGVPIGRKFSIQGSIAGDAIITAPILAAGQQIARWTVVGGALSSQTPEIVAMSGLTKGWTTNVDVVSTSSTDLTADYFVASYSDNTFAWVDGSSNTVSKSLEPISANYIQNAVDYTMFNNAGYAVLNWVNSFSWGSADAVWLLDVSNDANFSGNLETGTCDAVVWEAERNVYGGKSIDPPVVNANGTGDVALRVSEDGYYMYLYFMFTNGYVVGYQFDCIDM